MADLKDVVSLKEEVEIGERSAESSAKRTCDSSKTMLRLLIMQSTSFCNLDCSYCYLPDRSITNRMSEQTVDAVFADLMTARFLGNALTVVWHAGEPLAAGLGFYKHAVRAADILMTRGCFVHHSIQTNATLLDEQWAEFFKQNHISVGVSLDGPDWIHDRNRKSRSGMGSHDRVMRGLKVLRDSGVDFHVICVLTRYSLDYANELFDFFTSADVQRVGFNIDEMEGINSSSSMSAPDAYVRFQAFLTTFYDRSSGSTLRVREFETLRGLIRSGEYSRTNSQSAPFAIISVAATGEFSSFSPELLSMKHPKYNNFVFGNIHESSFASLESSQHFRRVRDDIDAGVQICRDTCEYFPLCGGGAPSNKLFENGRFDSSETTFCRFSKKAMIDLMLPLIETELGLGDEPACSDYGSPY